eukprot:8645176-Heterocapsa_arctica.AAC.1
MVWRRSGSRLLVSADLSAYRGRIRTNRSTVRRTISRVIETASSIDAARDGWSDEFAKCDGHQLCCEVYEVSNDPR